MAYTKDQVRVIESRGKNLLVSAAAGSGKTTVLVERVLKLIEEGANIDEFLIVTFTRAASADMLDKLYGRILERAQAGDRHFADQLERMDFASISTIHSFCMDVLRDNYEQADIDPAFRIIDDTEQKQMLTDSLTEVLEEAYRDRNDGMEQLIKLRETGEVRALVQSMYAYLCTRSDPAGWFEHAVSMMEDCTAYKDIVADEARDLLMDAYDQYSRALFIANSDSFPNDYIAMLEAEKELARSLTVLDYDALHEKFQTDYPVFITAPKVGAKSGVDPANKEACKNCRDGGKGKIKKALDLCKLPPEVAASDIREDIPVFRKLFDMAMRLMAVLREKKKDMGVLTFDDMEHMTIEVLSDPETAAKTREKYKYVFVDEYQDTSDKQNAIVSAVAGKVNLFMVGDIKQSIYRFRNAEPELFNQKYEDYRSLRDPVNECIVLRENFRSRKPIIDFVNLIFRRVMVGGDSDILYDEDAQLNVGQKERTGTDYPVELLIVDKEKDEDAKQTPADDTEEDGVEESEENGDAEEADEPESREYEALAAAKRIREIMAAEKRDFKDFCILSRNKKALAIAAGILASEGIPCYAEGNEAYFDTAEILVVTAALKLLVSRANEIELLAVLRSPMFDVTSTELAQMRSDAPEDASLWEAAEKAAQTNPKIARFMSLYGDWQVCRHGMRLCELIRKILSDTAFYTFAGALPGGEQRQANLDLLCQNALSYESRVNSSLSGFLDYMAEMQEKSDAGGASILSEKDNVVRLMTSHKSKGLQFPVVFMLHADRNFSQKGRNDSPLRADRDLGLALPHLDNARVSRRDTLAYRAIERRASLKDRAEELRVLYVTLTRPEDRLILVSCVNNAEKCIEKWRENAADPSKYSSALDIAATAVRSCPGSEVLGGKTDATFPTVVTTILPASGIRLPEEEEREEARAKIRRLLASDAFDRELYDTIKWTYPEKDKPYAPVKMAVTGLKREFTGGDRLPEAMTAPDFISGRDKNEYSDRGTAIHMALRQLDYAPFVENKDYAFVCEETARQLNALRDRDILTPEERDYVKPQVIADFILSDIGLRFMNAETKKREMSFSLRMPTKRVIPDYPGEGSIFVQGCIDMCFIEGGGWVLVDYKTNCTDDTEKLVQTYEYQLDIYAEALETLTGIPVKEAYLCLLKSGKQIKINTKKWEKA